MIQMRRREFLVTTALVLAGGFSARGDVIKGGLPWAPNAGDPPRQVRPGPWLFFTADEASAVEALVDRIIPPDPETPGGKDAGCAIFIDRQLAGPYGHDEGLYRAGPFLHGTKEQGPQSGTTPAQMYRTSLAELDRHCRATKSGKRFAELSAAEQDGVLHDIENGTISFKGVDARGFFDLLLKDVPEGFFSDPIHGGNRDMVGWRMIGFPGIRYDYRDWIDHHNERYPHPPVSIAGRAEWTPKS